MVLKEARLNDSDKAELVEQKRELNKAVSKSVELIFEAKDAWNGRPAPGIGVNEKHSINEPIPNESLTAMQDAVEALNRALSDLKNISNIQSEQHKQKVERIKSRHELDLSALASSSVSRLISHVKAPFISDDSKWIRLKHLRAASQVYERLEDINAAILSFSSLSIQTAVYNAKDLFYIVENELYNPIFFSQKDKGKQDQGQKQQQQVVEDEQIQQQQQRDYESGEVPYEIVELQYWLKTARIELETLKRQVPENQFKPFNLAYRDLIRGIRYVQGLMNTDFSNALSEHKKLMEQMDNFRNQINQISQGFQPTKQANKFTRFLQRKNVEYLTMPSNQSKAIRLKIDKLINNIYPLLDSFMESLEQTGTNLNSLNTKMAGIFDVFGKMYDVLADLAEIYNSGIKLEKHRAKLDSEKVSADIVNNTDIRALRVMSMKFLSMSQNLRGSNE